MTTTAPIHTARRPDIEAWLDQIGAGWRFNPDLVLAHVDQAAGLANQARHEPLTTEVVERYAADISRGDQFPPLLAEDDQPYALLGGNHRYAGLLVAKHTTHPAYLITAPEEVLLRIRFEDNRRHGLPATMAERLSHAVRLMEVGTSQKEAAAIVGVPQPKLSIAASTIEASRRARRLDIHGFARLPESTRYSLSQLDHDDVFAAAAELAVTAGLPAATVKSLVRAATTAEPIEALRLIGAEAEDHHSRATDRGGNVRKASRTARARLDTALAEIKGLDPDDIYDTCPSADVRAVLAQRIMDAAGVLHRSHELLTEKAHR